MADRLPNFWHNMSLWLVGIGALSIGTNQFFSFDILGFVPAGMFASIVIGAVGASGGYLVWLKLMKKI